MQMICFMTGIIRRCNFQLKGRGFLSEAQEEKRMGTKDKIKSTAPTTITFFPQYYRR